MKIIEKIQEGIAYGKAKNYDESIQSFKEAIAALLELREAKTKDLKRAKDIQTTLINAYQNLRMSYLQRSEELKNKDKDLASKYQQSAEHTLAEIKKLDNKTYNKIMGIFCGGVPPVAKQSNAFSDSAENEDTVQIRKEESSTQQPEPKKMKF